MNETKQFFFNFSTDYLPFLFIKNINYHLRKINSQLEFTITFLTVGGLSQTKATHTSMLNQ